MTTGNAQWLFLAIVTIVIGVGIFVALSDRWRANDTVRLVAKELNASFVEGGLFDHPWMEWTIDGCRSQLVLLGGDRNRPACTKIVIEVRDRTSGSLRVTRVDLHRAFLRRYGAPYMSLGHADFDRRFVVESTPASVANRLFSPARRARAIESLLKLTDFELASVELNAQSLVVMIGEHVTEAPKLQAFVGIAKELLRLILESAETPGILLGEVHLASIGECQVCGTDMTSEIVRCETCRTPHHRDCWQYNGRCSTYACRGRRCVA